MPIAVGSAYALLPVGEGEVSLLAKLSETRQKLRHLAGAMGIALRSRVLDATAQCAARFFDALQRGQHLPSAEERGHMRWPLIHQTSQ